MPATPSSWRGLLPGLVTTTVLVSIVYVVLRYAQVGQLHGDTIEIIAPVAAARGIMKGSDVWLVGFRVGKVKSVEFQPVSTDTTSRLVIKLDVLRRYAPLIRGDSYGQVRTGGTLIGAPVLYITAGTSATAALEDGDTLRTQPQLDTEGISSQVALATRFFPEILGNVRVIGAQLDSTNGTMGALLGDDRDRLGVVSARAGAVAQAIGSGRGTVGLALRDGRVMTRAQGLMARADTLRALLASNQTAAGRFRRDSTLLRDVRALLDEVTIVRSVLGEPRGTAGRALHDPAAYDQLGQLQRELSALMADIKRRPMRYVAF